MTLKQLKKECKDRGIEFEKGATEEELVALLQEAEQGSEEQE